MNTDKIDRKKRYYQKHRNRILRSLKEKRKPSKRESYVFNLGSYSGQASSFVQHNIEKLLLGLLVISCTGFLVAESSRTLQTIEGAYALPKALLCEMVLVGVSILAVSSRRMQVLRALVLVGIFVLSLLNTIGGPLTSFSQARQNVITKTEETSALNRAIEVKQLLLVRYLSSNRISGARRLESEVSSLSDRLTQTKQLLSEQRSERTLALGFVITVLLRLVIMAANIIFANRLGHLMRDQRFQTRPNNVATPPKLALIRT